MRRSSFFPRRLASARTSFFRSSLRRKSRRPLSLSLPTRKSHCTSVISASSKTSSAPSSTTLAHPSASSSACENARRDPPAAIQNVMNERLPLQQSPVNCYDSGVPLTTGLSDANQRHSRAGRHGEKTLPHRRSQPPGGFETVCASLLGNGIPNAPAAEKPRGQSPLPPG